MKNNIKKIVLVLIFCTIYSHGVRTQAANYYICGGNIGNSSNWYLDSNCTSPSGTIPGVHDIGEATGFVFSDYYVILDYTLNLSGTFKIDSPRPLIISGEFGSLNVINNGILNLDNYGSLDINSQGNLNIDTGGTVHVDSYANLIVNIGGSLNVINTGILNVNNTGILNVNNTGILNITDAGVLNITDYGTLNIISNGTLNISEGFLSIGNYGNLTVNNGTLTVNNNGVLGLNNGTLTIDNNGALIVNNGNVNLNNYASLYLLNYSVFINNGGLNTSAESIITTNASSTNNSTSTYLFNNLNLPYNIDIITGNNDTNYNMILSNQSIRASWTVTNLPPGLLFSTSTGIISGLSSTATSGVLYISSIGADSSFASQAVAFDSIDSVTPTLSSIASTTASTYTTITWTTDENATSTIDFGLTTSYGSASSSLTATTSQSITLSGLISNTTYHYRISSYDAAGNLATSSDRTFTTAATVIVIPPAVTPPTPIPSGPSFGGSSGGGSSSSYIPNVLIPIKATSSNTLTPKTKDSKKNKDICTPYIASKLIIQLGDKNNSETVKKIQVFLNTYEKETLVLDGIYKQVDVDAIKKFQEKHRSQILSPWGYSEGTGIIHSTTIAKINAIMCGESLGCPVFTLKTNRKSTHDEVIRVKNFLNQVVQSSLDTKNKSVDLATIRAISLFQSKYKDFVLKPLGLSRATGLWYDATIKRANVFMGCR